MLSIQNSQNNLKKNKFRTLIALDFKKYFKAIAIKTWPNDRQMYQQNKTDSLETNPHIYGKLNFDKDAKAIKWRKDSHFNKRHKNNWISICKK